MSTARDLVARARAAGVTIATAESCTGGLIAAAITDVAGASEVFLAGFVVYANRAKVEMLGVNAQTIAAHGAVSEQVAREMAHGALERGGVDLAISVTGIAGPTGSENKPIGRVCFGLAQTGLATRCETLDFGDLGRQGVRQSSVAHGLDMLANALKRLA